MRLRRTSTAAAVAVLGSLAVLGAAPVASATVATPSAKAATGSSTTSCPATTSLTGFAGAKVRVGGAPVVGHVTFTNVSGKPIPQILEALAFGQEAAQDPSTSLVVEYKMPNGSWVKAKYSGSMLIVRANETWPANGKDSFDLRVSAPAGTATGSYVGAAIAGSLASVQNNNAANTGRDVLKFQGCEGGGYTSAEGFSVVGASATKSASPSASASTSASASAPAPAASSSASASAPALATTGGGSDSGMIAGAAGALVVAGGAGVFIARRRKGAHN